MCWFWQFGHFWPILANFAVYFDIGPIYNQHMSISHIRINNLHWKYQVHQNIGSYIYVVQIDTANLLSKYGYRDDQIWSWGPISGSKMDNHSQRRDIGQNGLQGVPGPPWRVTSPPNPIIVYFWPLFRYTPLCFAHFQLSATIVIFRSARTNGVPEKTQYANLPFWPILAIFVNFVI